jgi:magnesium chelatase subunit I
MTEEEGHEDKLIHRIIDEAIKNIFTIHFDLRELRSIVDHFENGQSVEIGDVMPASEVLDRIGKVPGLRKRAEEIAHSWVAGPGEAPLRDAVAASAAEFMLQGLHVHNKINKQAKAGGTSYRR